MRRRRRHVSQAEVQNDHPPGGRHQDVGRFEIAVHDARAMQRHHPFDQLCQCGPEPGNIRSRCGLARRLGADVVEELDAVDQLHRVEPVVPIRHELVQRREIGVGDVAEHAELFFQAVDGGGVLPPQGLQRDGFVTLLIVRLVYCAHAAGAKPPADDKPIRAVKIVALYLHLSYLAGRCRRRT